MNLYASNDGRFPDDSDVEIRYPLTGDRAERGEWPWVAGWIAGQCGPNEWDIVVEGAGPTSYDDDGEPLYSAAYRDASEIRHTGLRRAVDRIADQLAEQEDAA
ncbi:hypothetical protein [Actinoplanes sp. NPDC049265]|uniref:hypothetical protein n=1 Tax=Actinoplanes sp. NPDC049265 TaxID=3363902 RepID=UPI003722CCFC